MKLKIGKEVIVDRYMERGSGVVIDINSKYATIDYQDKLLEVYYDYRTNFQDTETLSILEIPDNAIIIESGNEEGRALESETISYSNNAFKGEHYPGNKLRENIIIPNLKQISYHQLISYNDIAFPDKLDSKIENNLSKPGIYAWFSKTPFPGIPDKSDITITEDLLIEKNWILKLLGLGEYDFMQFKWRLRYVGLAKKQSLKSRLRKHFEGTADVSTLRKSIGSLLCPYLNICFNGDIFNNEYKLSNWMKENLKVYCFPTDHSEYIEKKLINRYSSDLYLNLKDKEKTRYLFKPLSKLRSKLAKAQNNRRLVEKAFNSYIKEANEWHSANQSVK